MIYFLYMYLNWLEKHEPLRSEHIYMAPAHGDINMTSHVEMSPSHYGTTAYSVILCEHESTYHTYSDSVIYSGIFLLIARSASGVT